jgi:hypothetical protein
LLKTNVSSGGFRQAQEKVAQRIDAILRRTLKKNTMLLEVKLNKEKN